MLEDFSDRLHRGFHRNPCSSAFFFCFVFDVVEAFDTVSHEVLLHTLHEYGFRASFLSIPQSFFFERSQIVSVANFMSTQVRLKAGVPQDSGLSPLLFNLYVNDISLRLYFCKMFQYANDTVLVSSHLDFHHSVGLLQQDIERVVDCFFDNLFTVNAAKTKLVCFRNPLKRTSLDTSVALHRSNCRGSECPTLDFVSSVQYLGVFFFILTCLGQHICRTSVANFELLVVSFSTTIFLCNLLPDDLSLMRWLIVCLDTV